MKTFFIASQVVVLACGAAFAHSWKAGEADKEALRAHLLQEWTDAQAPKQAGPVHASTQLASAGTALPLVAAAAASAGQAPGTAKAFQQFPKLELKWDADFLYVGSSGWPDHSMMVGITAWQQQVPLPQSYFGENAWRIPLKPVVAKKPQPVENHFLRGAIALAVNGIPIFNPQNNRGEVSYEIGELDQWGGHCGRADDYHYHIAPLHLESVVGKGLPIAYALDGYPIYGLTEPDGSSLRPLDECHGHEDAQLGYHYHASTKRPYLQSAFHGEVVEADGQVDPQPHANPVRQALTALRGAKITGFTSTGERSYKLSYEVNGDPRSVSYTIGADGTYPFAFDNGREGTAKEVYTARAGGGGRGPGPGGPEGKGGKGQGKGKGREMRPGDDRRPPRGDEPPPREPGDQDRRPPRGDEPPAAASADQPRSSDGRFMLTSPEIEDGAEMPKAYTGDGEALTPPLAWTGAPAGTQGYALIMDHTDREGAKKWYWTMYDIPAATTSFPRAVQGIGKMGTGFKGEVGYEPPHSQGPGTKIYTITMYALGAPLAMSLPPREVNRESLLAAIKGKVLASSSLRVAYTSNGNAGPGGKGKAPRGGEGGERPREGGRPMVQDSPPPPPPGQNGEAASGAPRKPWMQVHGMEMDADKDGFVTAAEMAADMRAAFALYDANKDGTILPREVDAAGDIREGAAFAGLIYRHAVDLDANTDSTITTPEAMAVAKYFFESADQNHDGKLSAEEIAAAPNAPLPVTGDGRAPVQASAPPPPPPVDRTGTVGERQPPQDKAFTGNGNPVKPMQSPGGGKGKGKGGGGKGGPDSKGLIKPSMADTIKVNVYADNWFILYINGKMTAVDSIDFIPHNVVSVDILPEYPMTIAVMAKDNADWNTGMEYGDHIGDGGFIIKFADGTVSNASWKAKSFFKGPLNHDSANPKVEHTPIPENWFAVDFDDSQWKAATEYTEERVNPKEPYYNADFAGAKFIWSDDLDLDNTVIFRTKVEKPGWTKRWNTKPDLDVRGAPLK